MPNLKTQASRPVVVVRRRVVPVVTRRRGASCCLCTGISDGIMNSQLNGVCDFLFDNLAEFTQFAVEALGIGFVSDAAERARLSRENADATHPHPEARAASLVIASACQHLVVQRGEREAVIRTALAEVSALVPVCSLADC